MGRILMVGLEVEGGWNGTPGRKPFESPIIADLSIDGNTLRTDRRLTNAHVGEVVSPPMLPDAYNINGWIDKHWPDSTNITCGYHIHTSFKNNRDYSILTTKSFLHYVHQQILGEARRLQLPDDHYLYQRLSGKNPFCLFNFDSSSQIAMKRKSVGDRTRYGMLNFAWNIHRTVEYRVFPTFETKDLAKAFTYCYLDAIETFLEEKAAATITEYSASLYSLNGVVNFSLKTPQEVV